MVSFDEKEGEGMGNDHGYVIIEIDTQKPSLEIYAPNYTTKYIYNEIILHSDEPLGEEHEFYVIDHEGNRSDYTFHQISENEYLGKVKFNFNNQILTLYSKVYDW